MPWVAAGAVVSAGIGAVASSSAAGQSAKGAQAATKLAQQQNYDTRSDLTPFKQVGHNASDILNNNLPGYGAPDNTYVKQNDGYINTANDFLARQNQYTGQAADVFNTAGQQYAAANALGQGGAAGQAALEQTPGYQFALSQGLRASQNSASARGLGVSGAALKGAATFATGLADQTYGNQFSRMLQGAQGTENYAKDLQSIGGNYGTQQSNALALGTGALNSNTAAQGNLTNSFNKLLSTSGQGESAAASTGSIGASLTDQAGKGLIAQGNANAAGSLGIGNAISGNIQGGIQNQLTQQYIDKYGPQAQAPGSIPYNGSYGTATGGQGFQDTTARF